VEEVEFFRPGLHDVVDMLDLHLARRAKFFNLPRAAPDAAVSRKEIAVDSSGSRV
jgi:hypothetical protein